MVREHKGLDAVAEVLRNGGTAVYPTETLYALGCLATDRAAAERVCEIKARPLTKPLPLIIGSMEGLAQVTEDVPHGVELLAKAFWPGPLSILVKARGCLSQSVSDETGYTSVRWTVHPAAAELCRLVGGPLVATSANVSGEKAASVPEELSPEVLAGASTAWLEQPWPGGGEPSTVVRVEESGELTVLRHGAISSAELIRKGFVLT